MGVLSSESLHGRVPPPGAAFRDLLRSTTPLTNSSVFRQ